MGCSNPHPHCQVWALNKLVGEPYKEMVSFEMFSEQNNQKCLLCEYTRVELLNEQHDAKNRVFYKNASFVAIVPFWAVWPFELLIVSRKHLASIAEITSPTIAPESHGGPTVLDDFSDILLVVNRTYDKLFSCIFPFSMGIHQSPTLNDPKMDLFHFHMHFYPPLLRGKNVKKFLVGFELLAEPQRDITVESAAKTLRSLL
ncbi:Galactose-1-phosphate uridylyltransferase [Zancudomyces culisetae]|uniref:Galactose-1-phosphate uridylyltransferase n=1 Tax=Zancudomyces culisetae TaxID=1213189 RepID=A0A1R1PVJ4_ZANCU|nr:Galactose-1-phosphate uridylyltransferase [Zancudomyces culisetae]|eukprot:OMH84902.1 Galactose-1-phosphate uridylyltransferase [Zancudomyces culisetae]